MDYQERQRALFAEVEALGQRGKALNPAPAPPGGFAADNRICLTAIAFAPPNLQESIERDAINLLRYADPRQYFYAPDALHLTVQNVRVIHDPPNFGAAEIEKARAIFRRVIPRHKTFAFELAGLLELPSSLALRAYSPADLQYLVAELRNELAQAGIADDKVYGSPDVFFGNITIARYNTAPNPAFGAQIARLKQQPFGALQLSAVTLITTNLACHPDKTRRIETFQLAPA